MGVLPVDFAVAAEAEPVMTNLRTTLENALSDLGTAIERECLEDVAIVVAYMREALAKSDEPGCADPWKSACCAECGERLEPGKYCSVTCATKAINRKASPPNRPCSGDGK